MKNKKGITLIALIITIVVLLILAGVSISLVTGDNGILTQAQDSKVKTDKAHIQEMKDLTAARAAMNLEGYTYTDKNNVLVYIPSNFAVSENPEEQTVEKGLVIIDKMGDEFVWVPAKNDGSDFKRKIGISWRIKSGVGDFEGSSEITSLRDDFGDNKLLSGSTSGGESTDIELNTVKNAGGFFVSRYEIGIESVARDTNKASYMEQAESNEGADYYLADVPNKEARRNLVPRLNSKQGMEPIRRISQLECLDLANEWKIGKDYQTGLMTGRTWDRMVSWICDDEENPEKFIESLANANSSDWGNYGWNTKSTTYKKIFVSDDDGKESGCANWGWSEKTNFSRSSLGKGNRFIFPTGEFITDSGRDTRMKNVYDVAGNVWEWTTEESHYHKDTNSNYDYRVLRGGSSNDKGDDCPATRRHGYHSGTTFANWIFGFRCVLYVTK